MFSTISLGALGALFLVGALLLVVSFVFTFSILSAIRDELLPWLPGQLHWWFKLIPAERELLRLKVKFAKIDRKKRPPSAMQVLKAKAQQVLEEFCTEQRRLAKEELKQMDDTETARLDDRLKGVIGVEAFDQIK